MATGSTYGNFNPSAIDPYPIETNLATAATAGSPAQANAMLNTYQAQRLASEGLYGQEVDQQHEAFKQQLAQQLYESNLKSLAEAKDPTTLQLMANSPTVRNSALSGIDAGTLSDLINRARQGQDVTNIEHLGAGVNSVSQSGFDPTNIAKQYGLPVDNYQGPASVQAAKINAAGRIAAAQAGGAGAGPTSTLTGPPLPGGIQFNRSYPGKLHMSPAQQLDDFKKAQETGQMTPSVGTDSSPAKQDEGGSQASGGKAPPGVKILQNDTQLPGGVHISQVQKQVRDSLPTMKDKEAVADILAGAETNGREPIIGQTAKGLVVIGKKGKMYGPGAQ